jgi:hypothetical protein
MAWTSTMKRPPAGIEVVAPTGASKPMAANSNPHAAIRTFHAALKSINPLLEPHNLMAMIARTTTCSCSG